MLLYNLFGELLILLLEYLNFSDKLQFSIVCKKFYKLDYTFYLDHVPFIYFNKKKRIELHEIRQKYIKNKKKMSNNLKRLTTLHERKFVLNQIFVENIEYFEKNFNSKSHYVFSLKNENYGRITYKSRDYNKNSLETESSSYLQYRIENLPEIFSVPNYDNIQYLLLENVTLPKIPKNIRYLTLVSCDKCHIYLDDCKELVFIKTFKCDFFYLSSRTKLHKLERLELTHVSQLLLQNVHSDITIFHNVTGFLHENFTSTNLMMYGYKEEYSNLFGDITGSITLEEFKYKPNINTLFFDRVTNFVNCTLNSKYLEDIFKNPNFLELFESITIDATEKFYDPVNSYNYSIKLYDLTLKKIIIACRSSGPYSKLPIIFDGINAHELVIRSPDHTLKVTNSNIKNIYVI